MPVIPQAYILFPPVLSGEDTNGRSSDFILKGIIRSSQPLVRSRSR